MFSGVIASVIVGVADLYVMVIFVYILMSWIPHNTGIVADVYNVLGTVCEPYLGIFRRLIPTVGMIDFSPIVAIVVLQLIVRLLV